MFRAGSITLARAQLARLAAADVCRRSGHATAEAAARETTQLRHFQHHRRVGPAAAGMGTGPDARGTDLLFEVSAPFLIFLSSPPPSHTFTKSSSPYTHSPAPERFPHRPLPTIPLWPARSCPSPYKAFPRRRDAVILATAVSRRATPPVYI